MPFFVGNMVEVPITCTQDYTLFHILQDYSIDLWKKQVGLIAAHHGLVSILVHPDYVIEPRARNVYETLLGYLAEMRDRDHVWTPLPREVAEWWRQRSQMKLAQKDGQWRVEGPGKERARIAYAHVADDHVTYSLQGEKVPAVSLGQE
jgi:hypothetical protein